MYAGAGFFARFLPNRFMQVFCSPIQLWFYISTFRIKDGAAVGEYVPCTAEGQKDPRVLVINIQHNHEVSLVGTVILTPRYITLAINQFLSRCGPNPVRPPGRTQDHTEEDSESQSSVWPHTDSTRRGGRTIPLNGELCHDVLSQTEFGRSVGELCKRS